MNKAVAGTTMQTTPLVRIGTTTIPTTATTILGFVWLCPRIDVLVNSWTRVFAYAKTSLLRGPAAIHGRFKN